LLPADRIHVRLAAGVATPAWLFPEDHVWLNALIDDFARLDGRPYREVAAFLQEPPRRPAPTGKRRMATWTLQSLCRRERPSLDAASLRSTLAVEAQRTRDEGRFNRAEVLSAAAQRLGLPSEAVEAHMFADLPGERRLRTPDPLPDPQSLAAHTNLALAQGLLRLASEVTIEIHGNARAVVRQMRLRRLLCTVRRAEPEGVRLEVSGPFSLFRHTTMYGRALASILPLLPWCERFDLAAQCVLRGKAVTVHLRPNDPLPAGTQPKAYDSRLEERFARDFGRANLNWDLVREPEPVETDGTLIFPDFAVVHRRDTSRRFLLEIVGFWTPGYLQEKLSRLREMPHTPLILCIDRALNCSSDELPSYARVVWFHGRIDPGEVLTAIESAPREDASCVARVDLADLFIDWAGRKPASDPVHRRLAALEPGTAVRFRREGSSIALETKDGPVAVLSKPGVTRWVGMLNRVVRAKVALVAERQSSQSALQWRPALRCARWKVPVVEVFLELSTARPGPSTCRPEISSSSKA
jgi:predicted nuclease of restriction endonuclease-like RecB superfamily